MSRLFNWQRFRKSIASAAVAGLALVPMLGGQRIQAAIFINEVYIDSPGSSDDDEYFEIRGTSSDSLQDVWLVQLENERGAMTAVPGDVDFVYNLSSYSFASSDHLWFASSGGEDYVGSPTANYSGTLENGGGTFLLIDTNGVGTNPSTSHEWDDNDDGVFDTNWNASWDIIDAVGVFATSDDITGSNDGRLYADINFAAGVTTGISAEGMAHAEGGSAIAAAIINTDRAALDGAGPPDTEPGENANGFAEIEYLGRYGDSIGKGVLNVDDWIAANATDNDIQNNIYEVSGDHALDADPEVVRGDDVIAPHAYGHALTGTLGSANSTSYTPEPTSVVMLVMGAMGFLLDGRRARA
jgi:hypothetical protein